MITRPIPLFARAFTAAILGTALTARADRPSVSSQPEPTRDYRLFVGLNVEVKMAEEFSSLDHYRLNRISTARLVDETVSLREVKDVRFTHETKIGRHPLTIGDIKTSRVAGTVYGGRNSMRNQQALQAYAHTQEQAGWRLLGEINAGEDTRGIEGSDPELEFSRTLNSLTEATANLAKATDPSVQGEQAAAHETDKHTALRITTEISSPIPIQNAYIVGVIRFTTAESGYDEKVFFKDIALLGPEPREIKITKAGLPEECEVKDIELHVYHGGQELVTNRSAKQFALTRAEALEYLTLARTSENRGQNLPPVPAWSLAPPQLFAQSRPEDLDYPITLQVDATGQVSAIDPDQVVPSLVREMARELLFQPALENGVPVAGTARVNLREYYP